MTVTQNLNKEIKELKEFHPSKIRSAAMDALILLTEIKAALALGSEVAIETINNLLNKDLETK